VQRLLAASGFAVLSCAILAALSAASLGWAATIRVPAEYPTIQAGIEAASGGDTVLVAEGTYTGDGNRDIVFLGKDIVVHAESGPQHTVVDCGGSESEPHRGFLFESGESRATVLSGFTVRGGDVTNAADLNQGGGLLIRGGSSPTIVDCVVSSNTARAGGGLSIVESSSPSIENCVVAENNAPWGTGIGVSTSPAYLYQCTVRDNVASGHFETTGGGLQCQGSPSPTVVECVFTGNVAATGGGVYCYGFASPVLTDCSFSDNMAVLGAAIATIRSAPTIETNLFSSNLASDMAGGVYSFASDCQIGGCTFSGNRAEDASGLSFGQGGTSVVRATIIHNGLEGEAVFCAQDAVVTLECCDVFDNEGGDWVGCIEGQYGTDGNIARDPLFCNPAEGDFTLAANSPCLPGAGIDGVLCGLIGAYGEGCPPSPVEEKSWGSIKLQFWR
jgi:hypothetical protein